MPWEKENLGVVMSVGQLQLVGVSQSETGSNHERLWSIPFASQAICMFYEPSCSIVVVGLDEGKVVAVQVKPESNFMKFDTLLDQKVHQARVMGVAYDSITSHVYSVGEDKFLKVTKLNDQQIVATFQIGSHALTNLHFDHYYKRLFITNRNGQIFIYDASSVTIPPLSLRSL